MKKTLIIIGFIGSALICDAQKDSAAMMKAWMAFMTPGDQHKMLAQSDGTWDEDITMWMAPGAPPTKSKATSENKMIMNGLYQQSMHKGSFDGMPFEGICNMGFDNGKKVFVSSWIDNMGSGIMHMEGPWDPATKMITMKGTQTDPMTGKSIAVRETFKVIDNNNHMLEMFSIGADGKEFKTMAIKLTRK